MCSAVALGNVVGVTENIFLKSIIPLQSHFHTDTVIPLRLEMKDFINWRLSLIEEVYEGT